MLNTLIDRYKSIKKKAQLNQYSSYQKKYAFVGVGNHSLSNLYPVLDFLSVPLKYIVTKTEDNAKLVAQKYNCEGTSDFSKVLADKEVEGVIICTAPSAHYTLVKQALQAGKKVFVEKPPCLSIQELDDLISLGDSEVVVGVQKRYSKVYQALKEKAKSVTSYNYRYVTGAYPEGDPIWDLFIHPLDVVSYLFGDTKEVKVVKNESTTMLLLQHDNGAIGCVELSTDYTWDGATEEMTAVTPKGVFELNNSFELSFTPKTRSILGVPLEKVFKKPQEKHLLLSNKGFVPTMEYNALNMQGYYKELKAFIDIVESKGVNQSSLSSLKTTFELIEKIK